MEADQTGPLGYTHFYLAYAYHIQMARDYFMSLGLFAGITQEKLNTGDIQVFDNNDPSLQTNGSVLVYPEIAPGIWLYNKSSWAGLSIFQVVGNRIKGFGADSRLTRHYLLSAGHRFRMSRQFSVLPSMLMKISPASPLALDINVMLEYRKRVGLGVSYRNQDAVAFMIKVPFLRFFTLGYSYDINTSRLRIANSNTHEVILGIYPCSALDPAKAIVRCPVFE
jgi:type IX secretion system PorP/SprF family membrane protein